jgi:hypothetical protein
MASADDEGFNEFLIAEFEHLGESLLRNEEDGERRVNTFFALAAGIATALSLLVGEKMGDLTWKVVPPVALALVGLFLFGCLTLRRLVHRNLQTDEYKTKLAAIRKHFAAAPERRALLPFDPHVAVPPRKCSPLSINKGGWLETVAILNSVVAGALAAVLLLPQLHWAFASAGLVVTSVTAWVALTSWANGLYQRG